ncbi:MAG: lipoyl domain-containing protein [Alphaproteobacteria bacterium]
MDVTLPKWGMTMQEAVIKEWAVAVGAPVRAGQPLVTVETDKVTAEVESPCAGTVEAILAAPEETVPVGAVIARIAPG